MIGLLMVAGAGASLGLWAWQRHRDHRLARDSREFESRLDADAAVVLSVATHEAGARSHPAVWAIHVVYGLLQDEAFTAAIERLGGDAKRVEERVLAALDKLPANHHDVTALEEIDEVFGSVYTIAHYNHRSITRADLWAYLGRCETARIVEDGDVTRHALLFLLVHGLREPALELPERSDVHVVLRNDDVTTQDFVVEILREVFALSDDDARARMQETHSAGRAIVARLPIAAARDKIITARARARERLFPLWIGIEDC